MEKDKRVIRKTVHGVSGSLVDSSIHLEDAKTLVLSDEQAKSLAEELHRIEVGRIAGGHRRRKK